MSNPKSNPDIQTRHVLFEKTSLLYDWDKAVSDAKNLLNSIDNPFSDEGTTIVNRLVELAKDEKLYRLIKERSNPDKKHIETKKDISDKIDKMLIENEEKINEIVFQQHQISELKRLNNVKS
jgi:hypothetical protein